MKRLVLMLTGLLLVSGSAFAQFRAKGNPDGKSDLSDQSILSRTFFGLGGGFGAGTGYSYYSILPVVGYRVSDKISAGTGLMYQHVSSSLNGPSTPYSQYGVLPFVRYNLNPLFFQTEIDEINTKVINQTPGVTEPQPKWFTRWLVGVGYRFPTGRRGAINALAMYDLLYKTGSPFLSPIVARLYFTF